MGHLRAESTSQDVFVTEFDCESVTLTAKSRQTAAPADFGALTNPTGDKRTWLVDPQSSEVSEDLLNHTLRMKYRQTAVGGQVLTTTIDVDVLDHDPPSPWLVTIHDCQERLRIGNTHGSELVKVIEAAHAAVEKGIGGALLAVTDTALVSVSAKSSSLRLANVPVRSVDAITDPYGNPWAPGAFLLDAAAGLLSATCGSPAASLIAATFGAQAPPQAPAGAISAGAWSVTYTGGLSVDSRWKRLIEPDMVMAILLTVEDAFNVHTSRATSEKDADQAWALDITVALPPRAASYCHYWSMNGA